MGIANWDIFLAGDPLVHNALPHANVPDQQLTHDNWCRRFQHDSGTGRGRALFVYNRETFNLTQDLSSRLAMAMPVSNLGETAMGVGVRLDSATPSGSGNIPTRFSNNGYWFNVIDDIDQYVLKLHRITASTAVELLSVTRPGTNGVNKWLQLRIDILMQANGDAVIQLWENNLTLVPAPGAAWTRVGDDIYELSGNVPAYSGVGWGLQTNATTDLYVDWAEVHRTP